jgi:isoleucyl-tRNA synthetase
VQDARKTSGLEVSDRIELWWSATDDELAAALREGTPRLGEEVLAVTVEQGPPYADIAPHDDADLGLRFWLRVAGA